LLVGALRSAVPFEGQFHFRQKIPARSVGITDTDYVWLDLLNDTDTLRVVSGNEIDILAIAIDIPDQGENGYSEYYSATIDQLERIGMGPKNRPMRQILNRQSEHYSQTVDARAKQESSESVGAAGSISLNDVTKAAANIWSTVVSTAASIPILGAQVSPMSRVAETNLRFLTSELTTPFSDTNATQIQVLRDLWDCIFPGVAFERQSSQWREVGFQKPDPVLDLKASGVLPLRAMGYLCHHYSSQAHSMITAQKGNTKSNYPFAIVAVNITLLLADILGLKDQRCCCLHLIFFIS
jgi:hypothetical protein